MHASAIYPTSILADPQKYCTPEEMQALDEIPPPAGHSSQQGARLNSLSLVPPQATALPEMATTEMVRVAPQAPTPGWTQLFHENGRPVWSNNSTGEVSWTDPEQPKPSMRQVMSATHAAAHLHHADGGGAQTPLSDLFCLCGAGLCPCLLLPSFLLAPEWTRSKLGKGRKAVFGNEKHVEFNCHVCFLCVTCPCHSLRYCGRVVGHLC
jgi:hypothetical protein